MNTDRVAPQNIDAERAVIGAMMLPDADVIPDVVNLISAGQFYRGAHQKIFAAIMDLFKAGTDVCLLSVTKSLISRGDLESVGGVPYLQETLDSVPTAANVEYYAGLVCSEHLRRQTIQAASDAYNKAFDGTEEINKTISDTESRLLALRDGQFKQDVRHVKGPMKEAFENIQSAFNKGDHLIGLSSGFPGLDKYTSGFQPGDYIIIAGRPGIGKSTFAQNIMQHVGITKKLTVLFFSCEMRAENVTMRILSSESRIDFQEIRTGRFAPAKWDDLTAAAGRISEANIFFDDTTPIAPLEIRAKALRTKAKHGLDVVVVDYMQLMTSDNKTENRQQEVSAISGALKGIGRELNVPMIALSQLSRSVESRPDSDKRPKLSDLRESGAIEQDADLVLFLYRDEYYTKENTTAPGEAELIIGKQRNGPPGKVRLRFNPSCMTFESVGGAW